MKPVETEACNYTFKLAGGTEENDLPCIRRAGTVTSFWEPTGDEIQAILFDGRVVIWVWWPDMVGVEVGLTSVMGDGGAALSNQTPIKAHPYIDGSARGWAYIFELDQRERQALRNGSKVSLTVDAMPPPPVSVTPYEEDEDDG